MKKKKQVGRPNQKTKIDNRKVAGDFDVRIGYATAAAAEISGDAAISCGLPSGSRALILSDGMGKGIKAAAGSRLVVNRLRKNLKEGMPVAKAIKEVNKYMIDHAIRLRRKAGTNAGTEFGANSGAGLSTATGAKPDEKVGAGPGADPNTKLGAVTGAEFGTDFGNRICAGDCDETFATVDLTIIDRKFCRAKFYKMGAATSFIVRGSRVRRIARAALPVGIIPTLKLTQISAQLKDGDIIVMVSDGITDADRNDLEANWLTAYLSNYVEKIHSNRETVSSHGETIESNYVERTNPDNIITHLNNETIYSNISKEIFEPHIPLCGSKQDRTDLSEERRVNQRQRERSVTQSPGERHINKNQEGRGINQNQKGALCEQRTIGEGPDISLLSPRALAADILSEAQHKYGTRERDDLTVAVAIIIDNENK